MPSPVSVNDGSVWNYLYADSTSGCTSLANATVITVPIFIRGNLCMANSAQITGANVEVGGNIQAGAAWFSLNPNGSVARQGYLATAGNNVIYPGIATLADGRGAMAVNLLGRGWYPSAAYALVDGSGVHGLHVAAAGRSPQDGFCEYDGRCTCQSTEHMPGRHDRWEELAV